MIDDDDEEKSQVELDREKINVVVGKATTDENDLPIEEKKEEVKETIEENKEEVEDLEKEKSEAKTQREKDRIQKRIDKLNGENKDLKKQVADLQAKLNAKPEDEKVLTQDDVKTAAQQMAAAELANRDFVNNCNILAKEAVKINKNFMTEVKAMAEELGPIPNEVISLLSELDNGGEVLNYLAQNIEDAEETYEFIKEGKIAKASVRLAKLSDTLIEKKKKPKEISKVPPPNEPLGGKQIINDNIEITGKESQAEYNRKRAAQEQRKYEARFGRKS